MDARQPSEKANKSTITYTRKNHNKELRRNTSYVKIFHAFSGKKLTFEKEQKLGKGTYGKAYHFSDGDQSMVVKKPRSSRIVHLTENSREHAKELAHNELIFTRRAYPQYGPYHLFEFTDSAKHTEGYIYDYRMTLPYCEGKDLNSVAAMRPAREVIFYLFYQIAKEVHRLHQQKQIIHGDLSSSNIIVTPDLKIKLVDFSFAYSVGENASIFELEAGVKTYIAPERINAKDTVKGHATQDIYTLAHTFKQIYQMALTFEEQLQFIKAYPCIEEFITAGLSANSLLRTSLPELISAMKEQLFVPKMVALAYANSIIDLRYLVTLDNLTKHRKIIYECLYSLLKRGFVREADIVLNQLNHAILREQDKAITDLFIYITLHSQNANKIHTHGFHQNHRHQLIDSILAGNQLAEMMLFHPNVPLSSPLLKEIERLPGLKDVYVYLVQTKCLLDPKKVVIDYEPLTCVFN